MYQIFLKGGPIMWPLLVLSVVSVALMIERFIFIARDRASRSHIDRDKVVSLVREGQRDRAARVALESTDPICRAIGFGLLNVTASFEEAVSHAADREADKFGRGLAVLDTAVTLAPLLGLLGTVTGMIRAFGLLGASELDAPVAITGGIAEALIATAFGLGIAIIALMPFNFLQTAREKRLREIEDQSTEINLILKDKSRKAVISEAA